MFVTAVNVCLVTDYLDYLVWSVSVCQVNISFSRFKLFTESSLSVNVSEHMLIKLLQNCLKSKILKEGCPSLLTIVCFWSLDLQQETLHTPSR